MAEEGRQGSTQPTSANQPVVLIVEDEDLVARMYQTNMQHAGFNVQIARDGEEGLEMVRKLKPGVVITDIMMPRMNGVQLLDEIKADQALAKTPVVILSNLSGEYDKELAMGKGAVGYWVKKDLPPKQMEAEVKKILGMG